MAREFLRLTPETTWGTYDNAATPILVDIDGSNGYTVRPQPIRYTVRTAGVGNRRLLTGSGKKSLGGNLNMLIHGSQAAALMAWIVADPVTRAIGSMTIDHCIQMEDTGSTKVYSRDTGMMVAQAQFNSGEQDQLIRLQLQLAGQQRTAITATDFAEPAASDYASDPLYVFEMASGGLTIGDVRLDFETFNLTVKNILDTRFFVGAYPQMVKYCGRDIDWTSRLAYGSSVLRDNLDAVTAVAGSITFTNGAHSLAFDMQSSNYTASVQDDLSLDKIFVQEVSMESYVDHTSGTDFTVTVS